MAAIDLTKKRTIDFDPLKCELKDNSVILFSPLDFIEGNNLYLPEKVRMSDGSINENVVFDPWSFNRELELYDGESISLYAGKNYIHAIFNVFNDHITEFKQIIKYFHLPKVINIFLYDNDIDICLPSGTVIKCTSKNGILYFGSDLYFVPDRNPYAESLPLTPVHGIYEDTYSCIDGIDLEGCGRDMFGGIYTLDGKSFIRWDGHDLVNSYRIRNGVEEIREKAFRLGNGSGLSIKNIYLPDTLRRIGREAFMSCRLITNITIPKNVIEIGEDAFFNCQSLESVTLSSDLRFIGKKAFGTTGLKKIYIPENVVHIGDKCFDNCWQLSSIKVGEKNQHYSSDDGILYNFEKNVLLRIPPLLFPDSEQNTNLRKEKREKEIISGTDVIVEYINLLEGITFITKKDSKNGKEYKEVIENKDEPLFPQLLLLDNNKIVIREWELSKGCRIYVDDGDFVESGKVIGIEWESPMEYYGPSRKEYAIQEFVKTLADGALQRSTLEKLIIPKNVECIGEDQFQFCNISEIIISPENEYYEFRDNSLIDKKSKKLLHWFGKEVDIVIPQGVEIIGERAFEHCRFKTLIIPEGVKCIETHAFSCDIAGYNIFLPSSLCYVATDAFYGINGMRDYDCEYNIYVPHGLKQKYVKLLGKHYGLSRDIKEIDSVPNEANSSNDSYKDIAVATEEDLAQAVTDEYGVKYSKDGKRLLKFEGSSIVRVKDGTEVVCNDADNVFLTEVHLPASVKYLGIDSIYADSLIIDGKDTYIAGLNLGECNTVFVPCGTWAKYFAQIESNVVNSPDAQCEIEEYGGYEDFKEYKEQYTLIELSKSSIALYLKKQKDLLIEIISKQKVVSEFTIDSINGASEQRLICFRLASMTFLLKDMHSFAFYFDNIICSLGFTLQNVSDFLGVKLCKIEVNEDNRNAIIGKTIATRVFKTWNEDFVDEETGEVESIERRTLIIESGSTIDEEDFNYLLDEGFAEVTVYDEEANHSYNVLIENYPDTDTKEDWSDVLENLFSGGNINKISDDEKKTMAYNLLIAYKAMIDHYGYIEDIHLPLRVKPEEIHSEITSEEKRLIDLISEFYEQKIYTILKCQTDFDVMPLFTPDQGMCNLLVDFLKDKGISEILINSLVKQLFDRL